MSEKILKIGVVFVCCLVVLKVSHSYISAPSPSSEALEQAREEGMQSLLKQVQQLSEQLRHQATGKTLEHIASKLPNPAPSNNNNNIKIEPCTLSVSGGDIGGSWSWKTVLAGVRDTAPYELVGFQKLISFALPTEMRNNFAVNIGARDGLEHDPVHELLSNLKYKGLALEGDPAWLPKLANNMKAVNHSQGVFIYPHFVNSRNLISVFDAYKVPKNLDVLKIDIDSIDLPILRTILQADYRPRFLMIEINPDFPPPFEWYIEDTVDFKFVYPRTIAGLYGLSPTSGFNLAWQYGYHVLDIELFDRHVPCPFCEHNVWFVHEDVLRIMQKCSAAADTSSSSPEKLKERYVAEWDSFVDLFWLRQAPGDGRENCLHAAGPACPKALMQIKTLSPARTASIKISDPANRHLADEILAIQGAHFKAMCPECTIPASMPKSPEEMVKLRKI